jgi:peptidoglycan/LPS O-acetylase OafA/YrhL
MGISFILIATHEWFVQQKRHGGIFTALFRWFGRNSYEIYLTHMFIVTIMAQIFYGIHIPVKVLLFWYISIVIFSGVSGYFIAIYFSEPLNRFLRLKPFSVTDFQTQT